ncbi:MAG: pyridoxamine 5'-phosphate oxidase family protein [Methanomicrobiales archaeon]|nr:pyridoxamine 5'-phosphate oxidase family protein [Methanomicrobiales archaeon]
MRRSEKEIADRAEREARLQEAAVCRIGSCDGGRPYVVPVTFVYEAGAVFIHSGPEGEKIRILRGNPRVCVEMDTIGRVFPADEPCRWTVSYRSVIAGGMAEGIEKEDGKVRALTSLVRKYSGRGAAEFLRERLDEVIVIRIPLDSMTGKASPCLT